MQQFYLKICRFSHPRCFFRSIYRRRMQEPQALKCNESHVYPSLVINVMNDAATRALGGNSNSNYLENFFQTQIFEFDLL